jgi:leucyl aminopeptidase
MKAAFTLFALSALYAAIEACPEGPKKQLSEVLGVEPRDLLESSEPIVTLQFGPDDIRNVTESEKFELLKAHIKFFDITDQTEVVNSFADETTVAAVTYPNAVAFTTRVAALLPRLSKANMQSTLTTFAGFYNRYYKSTYGQQSSAWLQSQVDTIIRNSNATGANVRAFSHSFTQNSIIATIPGKSAKTLVVGAHQDSINLNNPSSGQAPGADDDGSGSMTILEAFRVLLTDPTIRAGGAENTIEFHWYAGEEAGLLGSQAIFSNYKSNGKNVVAMLNEDMTGYSGAYTRDGRPRKISFITDNINAALTAFSKKIVTAYATIGFTENACGYACSDHASATRNGFPSAMISEGIMRDMSPFLHTTKDVLSTIDYDHMLDHAKVTVGWVYELAFASL